MKPLQKAIIEWDVMNWWCAAQFWEDRIPVDLSGTSSLEIGSRAGGLSLWLARKNSQVTCSDKETPEPHVAAFHREWGVSNRIRYESIDATNIPYENEFDIVIFKSVLGAVGSDNNFGKIERAIQEMHAALKPGGLLLFAENLNAPFHDFFRKRFVKWGNRWRYPTREELLSSFTSFTKVEHGSTGFLGAFGRSEWQRRFLGKIDRLFFSRMVGPRHHYIIYGIATK
jgi:SAM-dependent methyltransferase